MAKQYPKIAEGGNFQTAWLKFKTVKSSKGNDLEVLQGSIDFGGGNMVKLTLYADCNTVDVKGEQMLPVRVSKWKSTRQNQNTSRAKKAW